MYDLLRILVTLFYAVRARSLLTTYHTLNTEVFCKPRSSSSFPVYFSTIEGQCNGNQLTKLIKLIIVKIDYNDEMYNLPHTQHIKKLSSEVGPPNLTEGKVIVKLTIFSAFLYSTRNSRFAGFLGAQSSWGLGCTQTKYKEQNSPSCKEELCFMFIR